MDQTTPDNTMQSGGTGKPSVVSSPASGNRKPSGNAPRKDILSAARGLVVKIAKTFWNNLKITDLEPEEATVESIRSGISFRGSQLVILILAIIVASLGLNTDSIPVIIGAMLISPLMGPIIGMGLALAIGDYEMLRRGLKNISLAVAGSVIASAIYFLISPQYEGTSQLLARTSPSIYDVFIALFGGAAGIVSIAVRNKGQVMPGVAIATSLMPPLCTAGYGLATFQMNIFFGAFYLFFTNCLFILVASWIVVKLLKYKPAVYANENRARRVRTIVYVIISLTLCLSVYLTVAMIRKSIFIRNAQAFVEKEMVFPNTQVLSHSEHVTNGKRIIDVTLIGEALNTDSLKLALYQKLDSAGMGGTILNIRQGFAMGPNGTEAPRDIADLYGAMQNEITRRQTTIDSLNAVIKLRTHFSDEAPKIAPEVRAIFPTVRDIALSSMIIAATEPSEAVTGVSEPTVEPDTVNIAFVNAPGGLSAADRDKLARYIEARLNQPNVHVSVNPANYPWRR